MSSRSDNAVEVVNRIAGRIAPIDWSNLPEAQETVGAFLDRVLAQPELLGDLARQAAAVGWEGCESYPQMDKIVLWRNDELEMRLRLHIFGPGYVDRPHNHRWSFASRILTGAYVHSVYGSEADVMQLLREGKPPRLLYSQVERPGSQYLLDHSAVHSLRTDQWTVSLLLRGPAVKEEYFTIEPVSSGQLMERVRWSGGAAHESDARRAEKELTVAGRQRLGAVLRQLYRS